MRALVVEDDFVSRQLLNKFLSPHFRCDVAVDGKEAVAAFKLAQEENEPYHLICLDIMMPEMDGHEVLGAVRAMEAERGVAGLDAVKIVMTTALDDAKTVMKAFREQCEAYLVKPIDRSKLLDQVRELGLLD